MLLFWNQAQSHMTTNQKAGLAYGAPPPKSASDMIVACDFSPWRIQISLKAVLKSVYTCYFVRCDCPPGVCNKPMIVCAARFPLLIRSSSSSMLSRVQHIRQDINHEAQNRKCKRSFTRCNDIQIWNLSRNMYRCIVSPDHWDLHREA